MFLKRLKYTRLSLKYSKKKLIVFGSLKQGFLNCALHEGTKCSAKKY